MAKVCSKLTVPVPSLTVFCDQLTVCVSVSLLAGGKAPFVLRAVQLLNSEP